MPKTKKKTKKKPTIFKYAKLEQPLYAVVMSGGKPKLVEARLTDQTYNGKLALKGEALRYMNIGDFPTPDKIKLFMKSKRAAWNRFAREKFKEAKELRKEAAACQRWSFIAQDYAKQA